MCNALYLPADNIMWCTRIVQFTDEVPSLPAISLPLHPDVQRHAIAAPTASFLSIYRYSHCNDGESVDVGGETLNVQLIMSCFVQTKLLLLHFYDQALFWDFTGTVITLTILVRVATRYAAIACSLYACACGQRSPTALPLKRSVTSAMPCQQVCLS